jgi:hypothetical protein
MLKPTLLRTLQVDPKVHPRGQPHLSAASGLVHVQGRCYVVADDEHHLGYFKLQDNNPVKLKRLFSDDLPVDPIKRKAAKPDLEVLTLLPATLRYPFGALLALGSGSKLQRHGGVLMALNGAGKLGKGDDLVSQRLDLTELYAPLHHEFADLNIEGCFVSGDVLHLLQRGNKGENSSACITWHLPQVQAWLLDPEDTPAPEHSQITAIDLGQIEGVPLTPTDGCVLPNGNWLLSAAAENTADSYLDGPCTGSALAVVSPAGQLLQLHRLQGAPKVEGISVVAQTNAKQVTVLMVTDADDPDVPSQLLTVNCSIFLSTD